MPFKPAELHTDVQEHLFREVDVSNSNQLAIVQIANVLPRCPDGVMLISYYLYF